VGQWPLYGCRLSPDVPRRYWGCGTAPPVPLCVLHVGEDWLLLFPSELFTLLLVSLYSLPVVDEGLDHVHVYATLDITRWGDSRMVSQSPHASKRVSHHQNDAQYSSCKSDIYILLYYIILVTLIFIDEAFFRRYHLLSLYQIFGLMMLFSWGITFWILLHNWLRAYKRSVIADTGK
jgi:hypothetical protein